MSIAPNQSRADSGLPLPLPSIPILEPLLLTRKPLSLAKDIPPLTETRPDPTKPYLGASAPAFYASFAYFLLCGSLSFGPDLTIIPNG